MTIGARVSDVFSSIPFKNLEVDENDDEIMITKDQRVLLGQPPRQLDERFAACHLRYKEGAEPNPGGFRVSTLRRADPTLMIVPDYSRFLPRCRGILILVTRYYTLKWREGKRMKFTITLSLILIRHYWYR